MYVALQDSDSIDIIDTKSMSVIDTLRIGQSPMGLVYVARTRTGNTMNLSRQGLDKRIAILSIDVQGVTGSGIAQVRTLPGLDAIIIIVRELHVNHVFTVYAVRGQAATAILSVTSNAMGESPEALAFVHLFANYYDKIILRPTPS